MPAIVDTNLAGFTVTYNGVQFGGSDSQYKSMPPFYRFVGVPRYDRSGRAIIGTDYTLFIRCIFFHDGESNMASNMRAIREALQQPAKTLTIDGLGTGFNNIKPPSAQGIYQYPALDHGPKPGPIEMNAFGQLAWELGWSVSWFSPECVSLGGDQQNTFSSLAFVEFNFSTTWQNDFEGMSSRIIQGYLTIPGTRQDANMKILQNVAEQTRGGIIIALPFGFKRTANQWSQDETHTRLDFSIVDEQLNGDAYPPGVTLAQGSLGFSSGGEGNASMSKGIVTMNMTLKTAYNQPSNLAGRIFMVALLSKQAELMAPIDGVASITVVPLHFSIVNSKWDDARLTQCTISWIITRNLSDCLSATRIWQPFSVNLSAMGGNQDYVQWQASMASLWNNRGTSQIIPLVSESVVLDLCDNVTTKTIGAAGSTPNILIDASLPSLTCPTIPENGGWIHFDLDVRVHQTDRQTRHNKAATYIPSLGTVQTPYSNQPGSGNDGISTGVHGYSQSASDQQITEYHGYPEVLIGVTFSGLRYVNKPFVPEIKSVGGMPVRLVESSPSAPEWAFDAFGCPVWKISGYRVYSVPGPVSAIKPVTSLTATDISVPIEL